MSVSGNRWMVKIADKTLYLEDKAFKQLSIALEDKSVETVELDGMIFKKNQFKYAVEEKAPIQLSLEEKDRELKKVMVYDADGNKVSLWEMERRDKEEQMAYSKPIRADIEAGKELTVKDFRSQVTNLYGSTAISKLTERDKALLNEIFEKIKGIRESEMPMQTKIMKEFYWRGRVRNLLFGLIKTDIEEGEKNLTEGFKGLFI